MYQHQLLNASISLPVGKAVCVGQNYHDHIKEMGSIVNDEAVLFMKPSTAFVGIDTPISIPKTGECHHEIELVILVNQSLKMVTEQQALQAIAGITVGLDLTLRDVQKQLKALGRPWELAKAFDGSAVVAPFVPLDAFDDIQQLSLSLQVNGELRQQGNTQQMIRPVAQLIALISQHFTLQPGDVIFTGTPAGVSALKPEDKLVMSLEHYRFELSVAKEF
jgi:2-keto-4-pentenoate hydratase/2-oxohepta-3-ene-1,7-dioic acid hydratase in catechol pathway